MNKYQILIDKLEAKKRETIEERALKTGRLWEIEELIEMLQDEQYLEGEEERIICNKWTGLTDEELQILDDGLEKMGEIKPRPEEAKLHKELNIEQKRRKNE